MQKCIQWIQWCCQFMKINSLLNWTFLKFTKINCLLKLLSYKCYRENSIWRRSGYHCCLVICRHAVMPRIRLGALSIFCWAISLVFFAINKSNASWPWWHCKWCYCSRLVQLSKKALILKNHSHYLMPLPNCFGKNKLIRFFLARVPKTWIWF